VTPEVLSVSTVCSPSPFGTPLSSFFLAPQPVLFGFCGTSFFFIPEVSVCRFSSHRDQPFFFSPQLDVFCRPISLPPLISKVFYSLLLKDHDGLDPCDSLPFFPSRQGRPFLAPTLLPRVLPFFSIGRYLSINRTNPDVDGALSLPLPFAMEFLRALFRSSPSVFWIWALTNLLASNPSLCFFSLMSRKLVSFATYFRFFLSREQVFFFPLLFFFFSPAPPAISTGLFGPLESGGWIIR